MYHVKFALGTTQFEFSGHTREFVEARIAEFIRNLKKFVEDIEAGKIKIEEGIEKNHFRWSKPKKVIEDDNPL